MGLLIDTDHPIAILLQESDNITPAAWVMPILALRSSLAGDTRLPLPLRPDIPAIGFSRTTYVAPEINEQRCRLADVPLSSEHRT